MRAIKFASVRRGYVVNMLLVPTDAAVKQRGAQHVQQQSHKRPTISARRRRVYDALQGRGQRDKNRG